MTGYDSSNCRFSKSSMLSKKPSISMCLSGLLFLSRPVALSMSEKQSSLPITDPSTLLETPGIIKPSGQLRQGLERTLSLTDPCLMAVMSSFCVYLEVASLGHKAGTGGP